MSKLRLVGATVIGAVVAYLGSREFGLREPNAYECTEPATIVLRKQTFGMPSALELYVGGWIDQGSITVNGMPSRRRSGLDEITFSSNDEISHSFVGEWYTKDVTLEIEPTEDALCYILIKYRLR